MGAIGRYLSHKFCIHLLLKKGEEEGVLTN
jgi:hypothetical protein